MKNVVVQEDPYAPIVEAAYQHLLAVLPNLDDEAKQSVEDAFIMAKNAHEGTRRKSGEPYITHPLEVARIVVEEMSIQDHFSAICALLHDVVEDTDISLEVIERRFGKKVRDIIDGLTKMEGAGLITDIDSIQAENFRKILLTISDDVRVILIKLADRLHNMRTLGAKRRDKALKTASETLYIYAPLAHRLGLYEIKTELEDISLKISQPLIYDEIKAKLEADQKSAQTYIDRFVAGIEGRLKLTTNLGFNIKSRFKSISSIYAKMQRKRLPFEEIYDRYAIRIILDTTGDRDREREICWNVYSLISGVYKPNPKRIRDWITVPKENGYESLHTTLMGPQGRWVEVQIRTSRMDTIAEKGIAAHWRYKSNGEPYEDSITKWIDQIRVILENPSLNALEALAAFKENLNPHDVFVFTPKGEMVRLPMKATVLDFAYKIHTNIGNQAIGAKVNHEVVSLDHILKPGDQIEIITSEKQEPKSEWLRIAITPKAKDSIKKELQKHRKLAMEKGRRLFRWKAHAFDVDETHPFMNELLAYFMIPTAEDFFFQLGTRGVDAEKMQEFIQMKQAGEEVDETYISTWEQRKKALEARFEEFGVDEDMLIIGRETNINNIVTGQCCRPVPGDDILAYQDKDRIVVHRTGCQKAIRLMSSFGKNIIQAKWADNNKGITFQAAVKVVGLDRFGMLNDLIKIISLQMKLYIRKVSIESHKDLFEGHFHMYVRDNKELNRLLEIISQHPHVYTATRLNNEEEPFGRTLSE
ncbi:MAG: RelA/SpoT family protein [Bacteroidota bacterium]